LHRELSKLPKVLHPGLHVFNHCTLKKKTHISVIKETFLGLFGVMISKGKPGIWEQTRKENSIFSG
jgi:hypothetical protein